MWSVTLRLLWFFDLFVWFLVGGKASLYKVTDYISSKRAHNLISSFCVYFCCTRKTNAEWWAHDVVSYVTSFVVLNSNLPTFYGDTLYKKSLIYSVTAFISSKRAHIILLSLLCFLWHTKNKARIGGPRCGQLRYVFCGFLTHFFHDFIIVFTTFFSLMPSVTSLVSSKRAHIYH